MGGGEELRLLKRPAHYQVNGQLANQSRFVLLHIDDLYGQIALGWDPLGFSMIDLRWPQTTARLDS